MIGSECRRRNNNQFNRCSLNVQDKIDCNEINEIREKRITNLIYTGSATSRAYFQSSSNPLKIFIISVNPLQTLNTPSDPSLLYSRFSKRQLVSWIQFSQSKRQPVSWLQLTFWDEQKDFSPLEWMIQIGDPSRGISLF